jgi:hypothetical protein
VYHLIFHMDSNPTLFDFPLRRAIIWNLHLHHIPLKHLAMSYVPAS